MPPCIEIVLLMLQQPANVPRMADDNQERERGDDDVFPDIMTGDATATGNTTVMSSDAIDALCITRATNTHTSAQPSAIHGYNTVSTPPAAATPLPPLR